MTVVVGTKDALQIANILLSIFEPPIGALVREDDFKKLQNKEKVEAIHSFTKEWAIGELRSKKVLFISYEKEEEVMPIVENWEHFMGNDNVFYLEIKEDDEKATAQKGCGLHCNS